MHESRHLALEVKDFVFKTDYRCKKRTKNTEIFGIDVFFKENSKRR